MPDDARNDDRSDNRGFRLAGLVVAGRGAVDATVLPGQLALVEGPTLVDVSALLAVCAGHRRAAAGAVLWDGVPLPARPSARVGYTGRTETILGTLTPVENLLLTALAAQRGQSATLVATAEAQLAALDLGPATWHNLVEQLSGGQQQRVALARAFFGAPEVLVLDHPTSDLDPRNVGRVADLIDAARAAGTCCLLATDDPLLTGSVDLVVTA